MSLPPQPSTSASDVIAVLGDGFAQVFSAARPVKLTVREVAKVMEHPVEDGSTVTDFRVIQPVEIDLSLAVVGDGYRDIYAEIKQLFLASTLLTVQTRTASYSDMLISDMPHEEGVSPANGIIIALKLREVKLVKAEYGTFPPSAVANKSQSSTVDRGQQSGTTASPSQSSSGSILYQSFKG